MSSECCADPRPGRPAAGKRLRLWEVQPNMLCSIIGTCLTYAEMVKTARKAGVVPKEQATEYEVHAFVIREAAKPEPLAKFLHRALDRRYRSSIVGWRAAKSEAELDALWSRAMADGDIPGPYWALVTHPLTTAALIRRAFGDVHMLSHLQGSANRNSLRRLEKLERERGALSDRLAETERRLAAEAAGRERLADRHAEEMRNAERRLAAADAARAALAAAEARIAEFENGQAYSALGAERTALAADLERAREAIATERGRRESLERDLLRMEAAHEKASARLETAEARCRTLEMMHRGGFPDEPGGEEMDAAGMDLAGRNIAYVGGRSRTMGHFRALIEDLNGRFSHHDGGIDDNMSRLDRVLGQADVVMCPVDCVSHSACLKAKKFCKRNARTFVPLRSASLASLVTGLYEAVGDSSRTPCR